MSITRFSLGIFLLTTSAAFAHPFHDGAVSFAGGFAHPIHGLDHILAMIAIGVWAAQLGGRNTLLVPASFISAMVVGAILGVCGITIPFAETGILITSVILVLLVAATLRVPTTLGMLFVGIAALFHGNAHGLEMPPSLSVVTYFLGFVFATAVLHGIGIALSFKTRQLSAHAIRKASS